MQMRRPPNVRIAQLRMSHEERQVSDLMKAVILTASILVMITVIVALGVFVGLIPWILAQLKRSSANSYPIRHHDHVRMTTTPVPMDESSSSTISTSAIISTTSTTTTTAPSGTTPYIRRPSLTIIDALKPNRNDTKPDDLFVTPSQTPDDSDTSDWSTSTLMSTTSTRDKFVDEYFAAQPFEVILNGTNIELGFDIDVWLNSTKPPPDSECVPNPYSALTWEPLLKNNLSHTCRHNTSIYVPQPLMRNNSYYFGYPILQTISCYGSKLELRCPKSQRLHVFAAYYGNQMNTNYCNNDLDIICFRSASYDYLIEMCQNQTFCNLLVTERVFGNPCLDLMSNQIMVQYQCLDSAAQEIFEECPVRTEIPSNCPPLSNPSTQFEKYWCEPDTMQIECLDDSTVISVLCAFYGIDPNIKCSSPSSGLNSTQLPTACFSQSSQTRVASECNGRRDCSFSGEISFEIDSGFVNPCPGYQNMLYVQWECVNASSFSQQQLGSNDGFDEYDNNESGNSTLDGNNPITTTPFTLLNTTQNPTFCEDEEEDFSALTTQCAPHSFSPYEPKFATQSTQTYFHYPMQQQLVCQGSRLILVCPSPLIIHIHAAYYGIQSATRSSTCTTSSYEIPAKCYLPHSFDIINETCAHKPSCQLRATSSTLTNNNIDYCPSYQKQLLIQYMCVHANDYLARAIEQCPINWTVPPICAPVNTTESKIEQQTWCDGASVSIECPNSRIIEIVCAFYGIHPEIQECEIPRMEHKPVCYFASSSSILSSMCDNQSTCNIDTALTFNRDPCVGHAKALVIQWRCI